MSFTPGPWECVAATEHHGPYIVSEFGGTIADFYTMTLPNERSTASGGNSKPVLFMHEMAGPNARLAASAPELLKACQQALYLLKGREHDAFLRAAITKATGEP